LACAPYPKNGIVDPPIIQSNSNAKYGYCAVTYPTQNGSYSHRAGSFTTNRTIVNINGDSAPFNKIPISVSRESAQISINQNLDLQFKLGLKNQDYLSSSYGCQIIDKDNPGQLKKETGSGKCCSTYPSSGYLEGGLNKCSP
jgi:hypothetical protein